MSGGESSSSSDIDAGSSGKAVSDMMQYLNNYLIILSLIIRTQMLIINQAQ